MHYKECRIVAFLPSVVLKGNKPKRWVKNEPGLFEPFWSKLTIFSVNLTLKVLK